MAGNLTTHVRNFASSNPRRIFSPNVWRHCPLGDVVSGQVDGILISDDFINTPTFASATEEDGYLTYQDTGVTIAGSAGAENGVLVIGGNDADNDEGSIQWGAGTAAPFVIPDKAGGHPLWFEARIKKAGVAANGVALFVGLKEQAGAVAEALVDDTGAIADKDCIGFNVLHDSGAEVDIVYNKASGTIQTLKTAAGTMVADTWMNLGFYYNPGASADRRITFYVDNVEVGTYLTATMQDDGTNFPGGEEMSPILATKVGAAAAVIVSMDWWACCQLG